MWNRESKKLANQSFAYYSFCLNKVVKCIIAFSLAVFCVAFHCNNELYGPFSIQIVIHIRLIYMYTGKSAYISGKARVPVL